MANLFRRIYDWLLRLFWYAYLCPLRFAMRRSRCLKCHVISPIKTSGAKSKPVYEHDAR